MTAARQVHTHSLKPPDATNLFYLFNKYNKTWIPLTPKRTPKEERPRDESVGTRILTGKGTRGCVKAQQGISESHSTEDTISFFSLLLNY